MSNGSIAFDPVRPGRVWIAEGIGVWYCDTPIAPNTRPTLTAYSQSLGLPGIIVDQILKMPGSGPLIMSAQDRYGFQFSNPGKQPTGDFGICEAFAGGNAAGTHNGWGIDYAKDGSGFVVIAGDIGVCTGNINVKNLAFSRISSTVGFQAPVACQTAENFVVFTVGATPVYTKDGATFQKCNFTEFNGSTVSGGWSGFYANRNLVCADLVDRQTYYALNSGVYGAKAAVPIRGGANYTVGEILYIDGETNGGGGFSASSIFRVNSVDAVSGAITEISILEVGDSYAAPATAVVLATAKTISINDGGSGHSYNDVLTLLGGPGQRGSPIKITVKAVDANGAITGLSATAHAAGGGYGLFASDKVPSNPVPSTGGTGTSATFNLTWGGLGAVFNMTFLIKAGCWKSIDGGANWSQVSRGLITANSVTMSPAGHDMQMKAVPGHKGHLLLANGFRYNYGNFPACISVDGGAHWTALKGITKGWQIDAGPPRPGKSYASIIFTGLCSTDARPTVPGIFRADDVDPANLGATPTWVRLCDAPAENIDYPNTMCCDPDRFDVAYVGLGATGFAFTQPLS